jgi:hypothetical protein
LDLYARSIYERMRVFWVQQRGQTMANNTLLDEVKKTLTPRGEKLRSTPPNSIHTPDHSIL